MALLLIILRLKAELDFDALLLQLIFFQIWIQFYFL